MGNFWQVGNIARHRSATRVALGMGAVALGAGAQQAHAATIPVDFTINSLNYTNTSNTTGRPMMSDRFH